MNNNLNQQLNSQANPEISTLPKWLSLIFKIYGIISIIVGVMMIYVNVFEVLENIKNISVTIILPIILLIATAIYFVILGFGFINLKRWIVLLFPLYTILVFLVQFFKPTFFNLYNNYYNFIIAIVIFIFAFVYRRHFVGFYLYYPVIIVFAAIVILWIVNILLFTN